MEKKQCSVENIIMGLLIKKMQKNTEQMKVDEIQSTSLGNNMISCLYRNSTV